MYSLESKRENMQQVNATWSCNVLFSTEHREQLGN
jgi:hypothetical protein